MWHPPVRTGISCSLGTSSISRKNKISIAAQYCLRKKRRSHCRIVANWYRMCCLWETRRWKSSMMGPREMVRDTEEERSTSPMGCHMKANLGMEWGVAMGTKWCYCRILKFNHIEIYNGDWLNDMLNGQGRIKNCAVVSKKKREPCTGNGPQLHRWISYSG